MLKVLTLTVMDKDKFKRDDLVGCVCMLTYADLC
jgi:hypothetical protein